MTFVKLYGSSLRFGAKSSAECSVWQAGLSTMQPVLRVASMSQCCAP